MRRLFSFAAFLLVLSLFSPVVSAQDATPEAASPFADLGLPTLDITVTAAGYEGIPDSIEAGRYLVTLNAAEDTGEFGGGVAFVQPAGMTGDEFIAMLGELAGPPDESGVGAAAATPVEGGAASPEAEGGDMGGVPPFFFESVLAGGAYAPAGGSAQVVLDLPPGEWVAWGDDPASPQPPVAFEVTGEMPTDLVEPESSATLIMGEYVIEVTEGELTAEPQVVRIDNVGAQPHFIGWVQVPDGLTEAQLQVVLDEEMQAETTGTPPVYSDFNPEEDITDVTFTGTQSAGTSTWVMVEDAEAGTHVLICFFPDIADGLPHAYHGMYTIIEIAE
ncbi:MAG: hypothetical protein M3457_17445 [Chloroflexota bacterium]|nr:hypothetical protein [Chloroflexota bacterium]